MSEKVSSIAHVIRTNRRIALDSNVLIYLLEGNGPRAESAAQLVDAIGRGEIEGVFASVGLAEVLVPFGAGRTMGLCSSGPPRRSGTWTATRRAGRAGR